MAETTDISFLSVLEAGRFNIRVLAWVGFGEPSYTWMPSHCVLLYPFLPAWVWSKVHILLSCSSYKGSNHIMRIPPLWSDLNLIFFQRSHLQISSHWMLCLQHMNFGRIETFKKRKKHSVHNSHILGDGGSGPPFLVRWEVVRSTQYYIVPQSWTLNYFAFQFLFFCVLLWFPLASPYPQGFYCT